MTHRRWGPRRGDDERIRRHLERQRDVPDGFVKLDTGDVVRVGHLSVGEANVEINVEADDGDG